MNSILNFLGPICVVASVILEFGSYYKQINKTLRLGKSAHVSSSAFLWKIAKYLVTIAGLSIYQNWVAVMIEVFALVTCTIALYIVAQNKPKGWKLFGGSKGRKKK